MVKRLETPEELSKIYSVMPSKYIQWLTEGITNPKLHIWAEFDIDIIGYVVALDSVSFPLSDYFTILFDWGDTRGCLPELGAHARSCGATGGLVMAVPEITDEMKKAGFKQVSINIRMRL